MYWLAKTTHLTRVGNQNVINANVLLLLLFRLFDYYPALPASSCRGPPSVNSGFSISVQPAKPASPIGLLCEQ